MENLKRINPNFYPKPVIEIPSTNPIAVNGLIERKGDFLSEAELVQAHGKCGALMHSANPYGTQPDYDAYALMFQDWYARMINLLNNHQVKLLNDKGFYLVHMQELDRDDVRWYRFEPFNTTQQ